MENPKETTLKTQKKRSHVLWIVVLVVLIAILGSFGGYGVYFHNEEIKVLEDQNSELLKEFDSLQEYDKIYKDSISQLKFNIKILENEASNERSKRLRAEKALRDIPFLLFNRKYLDSLADHYQYEGPKVLPRGEEY